MVLGLLFRLRKYSEIMCYLILALRVVHNFANKEEKKLPFRIKASGVFQSLKFLQYYDL